MYSNLAIHLPLLPRRSHNPLSRRTSLLNCISFDWKVCTAFGSYFFDPPLQYSGSNDIGGSKGGCGEHRYAIAVSSGCGNARGGPRGGRFCFRFCG